jgi:hypothetical protein
LSYSTGRAEVKGIASMYLKSPAGAVRLNRSVDGLTATIPEMSCEFWKFAMLAGVRVLFAKYAASASSTASGLRSWP